MKYLVNNRDIPVLQGFMFAANGAPMKIINLPHHNQKIEILPPFKSRTELISQKKSFIDII
jgi:hypothetical protein